jgi:signal transduction histidine kinase
MNAKPAKRKSSLVSRLAATTALLAAVVVFLSIVFFQALQGTVFMGSFEEPLSEFATMMAGRIGDDRKIASTAATNHHIGIIVTHGDETYAFGPSGESIEPQVMLDHAVGFRRIDVRSHDGRSYSFFFDRNQLGRKHNTLLFGLIALLLATIGVVYWMQVRQLRPLGWLRDGVDAVSRGDLSTRVPIARQDEIGQVGRAFNHMTSRVQKMMSDQDRLLSDVSHELRSPLTRIKLALEMLPESDRRDSIADDVREMEGLISALLERQRVGSRTGHPDVAPVDLVELVNGVAKGFGDQTPGISVAEIPENLEIKADGPLVRVLVQNLLDNAIKFSLPDSKAIELSLRRDNDEAEITITDDGPGIPEGESERIFEPFVKLDPARGHRKGYGLGLNLCQRIVQAHNGTIEVESRQPRGTRVTVRLPLA